MAGRGAPTEMDIDIGVSSAHRLAHQSALTAADKVHNFWSRFPAPADGARCLHLPLYLSILHCATVERGRGNDLPQSSRLSLHVVPLGKGS